MVIGTENGINKQSPNSLQGSLVYFIRKQESIYVPALGKIVGQTRFSSIYRITNLG